MLHDWFLLVAAVWAYMTVWFALARLLDRVDVIDIAWGLGFVWLAWLAWALYGHAFGVQHLAVEFVTIWGFRLSGHILWRALHKAEDHRYTLYREKWGKYFWLRAYGNLFMVQAALLLAISTTTIAIMAATKPALPWLAVIGFVVWGLGIVFETEADAELARFVKTKKPGQILQTGLWRYSRHPNYFGELTSWWGAAIVALSLQQWWGVLGAALITLLITKVSGVPLLEQRYATNPAFKKYKQHTSILIPLPPKK